MKHLSNKYSCLSVLNVIEQVDFFVWPTRYFLDNLEFSFERSSGEWLLVENIELTRDQRSTIS